MVGSATPFRRSVRAIMVVVVGGILLLQACTRIDHGPQAGQEGLTPGPLHKATGLVRDGPAREAMLCLGPVLESNPPHPCDTVPLRGWDWDDVSGEERARGVTWGHYRVVGTYDGVFLTVLEGGPPQPGRGPVDPLVTPCQEPKGGWVAPDPTRTGLPFWKAAQRLAEAQSGFAGTWFDTPYEDELCPYPCEEPADRGPRVLNFGFTSDVARLRQELRELFGGPLCVTRFEYTHQELVQIQKELRDVVEELGLVFLWSDIPLARNHVELGVVAIDRETRRRLAARYENALRVITELRPVRRTS